MRQAAAEERARRVAEMEVGHSALEEQIKATRAELCSEKEKMLALQEKLSAAETELNALRERLNAMASERAVLEDRLAASAMEEHAPQIDADGGTKALEAAQAEWAIERDELVAQVEEADDARVRAEEKFAKIKALLQVRYSDAGCPDFLVFLASPVMLMWEVCGWESELWTVESTPCIWPRVVASQCECFTAAVQHCSVTVFQPFCKPWWQDLFRLWDASLYTPPRTPGLRRRRWKRARRCRPRWRSGRRRRMACGWSLKRPRHACKMLSHRWCEHLCFFEGRLCVRLGRRDSISFCCLAA
jgi:hypothetical protein